MFQGMEYVYEVYREGSFSRAAQKLFISQPSLSASVKRVESKVGYPIFDRSIKPVGLTECGKKYIQTVENILMQQNEFIQYINDWGDLKSGSLVLGGSSLFSSLILPSIMGEFSHRFPMVKLELVEATTAELEQLSLAGKLDLAIDNSVPSEELYDRKLFQEEQLLLAVPRHFMENEGLESYQITPNEVLSKSFLKKETREVPLRRFQDAPFILLKPENDTGRRALEICRKNGFQPRVIFELDQQMTSYNVTCSGMGISFVSSTLISRVTSHPNVVYYKLGGENSYRNIYFYWKKGKYFSRAMEEFLKIAGIQETVAKSGEMR